MYKRQNSYVIDRTSKDLSDLPDILEVELLSGSKEKVDMLDQIEKGRLNVIAYDLDEKPMSNMYYRVGRSNYLVVIFPMDQVKAKYQQQKVKSNPTTRAKSK